MACVALTSLMRTLELEFLQSNPRLILKDKEHIESLCQKLGCLQTLVDESEKKAHNCEKLKDLIAKIGGVALEAEYEIEAALVEILRHHQTLDQTLRRVLHEAEQLMEMIHLDKDLQTHHQHPEESLSSSQHTSTFQNAPHLAKDLQTHQHLEKSSLPGGQSSSQLHTSKFEDTMVGQAKEFEDFKGKLLQGSDEERQVMAVVGMGGIGKTTFARRVYDDSMVKSHFDHRGWATVSHEYNYRQVLLELCHSVMLAIPNDINTKTEDELADQLQKSLKGCRYLIILDDIWTPGAWDEVQRCFPAETTRGSRILLTTREKVVAESACSSKLVYDMRFLHLHESWNLFCQKLLVKGCLNKELETIGMNIVQKCHGLPITVVVLAGHLSTNMEVDEWKSVESMLNSSVNLDLSEQFSRTLSLSYNNLPGHLKSCFLYLGAFPKDRKIEIKKVIRLWIAEGFIKEEESEKTLEELGEDYLHDLINRSLIMISGRSSSNGKVKTCKMHDLLHDLCASKAKTQKLPCPGNFNTEVFVSIDSRLLCLRMVSSSSSLHVGINKCRSILCFDMYTFPARNWWLELTSFKMLRVLDLSVIGHSTIPCDIVDVVLLRYLALPSNKLLTCIPVAKNRNLQTLVVCEDIKGTEELPHGIWDLPQLRYLEFHHQLSIYKPEVVQVNLQTMYWVHSIQCTEQVFLRIPNVKELGIIARGIGYECCLDNLNCLDKLEKLKVQGAYSPIELRPDKAFPQNLKKITFSNTLMPWRAMNIIGMLPKLEVLKLKNHGCLGKEWELNEKDGFSGLKFLLISESNLKHWETSDDVEKPFPVIEGLVLKNCFELKEMPSWIAQCMNLKTIQIEHCNASLGRSARTIEEDRREIGDESLEIFEFPTQSDEDQKNRERELEIEEDEMNSEAQSVWIGARSLCIAWVENPAYWTWITNSGHDVVKLEAVCWLDIKGTLDTKCLHIMTIYSAYLVYKLELWEQGFEDSAFASVRYLKDRKNYHKNHELWEQGFEDSAFASVRYLKDRKNYHKNQRCQVVLAKSCSSRWRSSRFPNCRCDGWIEIKLGDFLVSSGNEGEVEMRFWNTENMGWKSGLIVRGIEVRPKMKVG